MCSGSDGATSATGFRNASDQLAVTFSPKALSDGLRAIYNKDLDVRTDIERSIFDETLRLFNEATAQGLAESQEPAIITDRFLYELRTNNAVFSAFKTHRMQNDIAAQLIDPVTGRLKSFDRWMRDIKGMTDHYCRAWLQTEYDTAVLRAHQAADWKHFLEEADVFPNVRWMPTTSVTPDPLHQHYWEKKLTLPVNHPFWQEHRPGDRWNCKCSLMQTDEPVNTEALDGYTPPLPMPGLDNNPADDGKIFSDTHPYITEAYPGAEEAVTTFLKKRSPSSMRRTEEEKKRILEAWQQRTKMRENEKAVASALNMKVPKKEMTFEAANQQRSNPKFLEARRFQVNCQCCVVSHELRMRGFDVEAVGNTKKLGTVPYTLSRRTQLAWIDPATNAEPVLTRAFDFKRMLEQATEVGRYHVRFRYKNGGGHIITFERTKDGVLFYDPQPGKKYTLEDLNKRYDSLNTRAQIEYNSLEFYRVDKLTLNTDYVKAVKKKGR